MDDKSYNIRVPKRWVRIALIVGVTTLIVAPLSAVATHTFNDVPNDHTFHDNIAWLRDADVTRGCNPPANNLYCPGDNVTRGQMAAFIERLATNQVVDAGTLEGYSSTDLAPRAAFNSDEEGNSTGGTKTLSTEITAPAPGLLIATGSMQTFSGLGFDTTTCWLEVDDEKVHGSEAKSIHGTANHTCIATGAAVVDTGTYTVDIEASGPEWYWDETVWVIWVPFDGAGMTP